MLPVSVTAWPVLPLPLPEAGDGVMVYRRPWSTAGFGLTEMVHGRPELQRNMKLVVEVCAVALNAV